MCREVPRCTRCVVPATYPGIRFDGDGVCSLCSDFDRKWGKWLHSIEQRAQAKARLIKTLNDARRGTGKYDCIVPTSGGRDSLYVLHLCTVEYDLKPLVFTVDNGFWAEDARKNLDTVVEALHLDHVVVKPQGIMKLYRLFLYESGDFCAPCNYFIFHLPTDYALRHRIPLVVMGGCRRVDSVLPGGPDPWRFRRVVRTAHDNQYLRAYSRFPWRFFLYYAVVGRRVQPLDYLDWTYDSRKAVLEQTYGIHINGEHADCAAHDAVAYLSRRRSRLRKYGFGYETVKYSQLVRNGLMTREEALRRVEEEGMEESPKSLDSVLVSLNMSEAEFYELVESLPNMDKYAGAMSLLTSQWRQLGFRLNLEQTRFYPYL